MTPVRKLCEAMQDITRDDLHLLDSMALWHVQQMAHSVEASARNILAQRGEQPHRSNPERLA